MRWQILIPHMPHRHQQLVELLDILAAQMEPGVQVVMYTDNLEHSYTEKLQTLMDTATADYVSVLSNDDSIAPDFVARILEALIDDPDYVGFRVKYTEDGRQMMPVVHSSLHADCWSDMPHLLLRDFMYFNPIRRSIAQQVTFRGDFCDVEWGEDIRALGAVRHEVFVDEELLIYQRRSDDNFHTKRVPMPAEEIPELPSVEEYPFLLHLDPSQVPS